MKLLTLHCNVLFFALHFRPALRHLKNKTPNSRSLVCLEDPVTEPHPEMDKPSQRPHILVL
jgi:hypothetical protein